MLHELLPRLRQQLSLSGYDNAPRGKFPRATSDQKRQAASRSQRMREYRLVQYLRRQGYGERRIAHVLDMSRGKVRSLYAAKQFPERKVHYIPSRLDPYLPYLEQRAGEGCLNLQQLWREIRERGYPGSSSQVSKWLSTYRNAIQKRHSQPPSPAVPRLPDWRFCARIITSAPDRLTPADQFLLEQIRQESLLENLYQLTQRFTTIIRKRQATLLDE